MKAFEVVKPGFFTTVQDAGRYGYLRYGVPVSGAMDQFSFTVANRLVGNAGNEAALEITLIGPELRVLTEARVAVTGGNISPRINDQGVPMWQTLMVREGDMISFGKMETGCRSYLSISGGIDVPLVLGSRSAYVRGCFGGTAGRQLKVGDEIERLKTEYYPPVGYKLAEDLIPRFQKRIEVGVVLGPQADMFTKKGTETFLSNRYIVTVESDRMGYRLDGPRIEHRDKADIVSDALLPGAIQVPKNGTPIVIMRDAQTTGGYAKIAVAITADLHKLGQARPGDSIEFHEVSVQEAQQKLREYQTLLDSLTLRT